MRSKFNQKKESDNIRTCFKVCPLGMSAEAFCFWLSQGHTEYMHHIPTINHCFCATIAIAYHALVLPVSIEMKAEL